MTRSSSTLLRILGVAHIAVAIVLLPATFFLGCISMFVVPPALIWLGILGIQLWQSDRRHLMVLRYTHLTLGPFAILLVVYGIFALRAGQRSAEAGGRLLSTFGVIPIVMGLLAGCLAIGALCVSYSTIFEEPTGGDSGNAPENPG